MKKDLLIIFLGFLSTSIGMIGGYALGRLNSPIHTVSCETERIDRLNLIETNFDQDKYGYNICSTRRNE